MKQILPTMYDKNLIIENFMGLVGLRQNDNPEFPLIPPSLLYDGQNTLIQHALVNIENIDLCARNYSKFEYPAWSALTNYTTGQRSKYAGVIYEANEDNINKQPDINATEWTSVNLLGLYLTDVFSNAIEEFVANVFRRKKLAHQTKTLIDSVRPFDQPGSSADLIINDGSLVGISVQLRHTNNLMVIFEKIGLQVSQANPDMKFFIYHSSQVDGPILTITKNHTKAFSFQWHVTPEVKMHYMSNDYDAGGNFFIMYDQNLLVGQAIKKVHNFNFAPCSYCNEMVSKSFQLYSKYVNVQTIRVKAADRVAPLAPGGPDQLWDLTKTERTPDNNFGMNFEMTVRCDLTDFLIQQKEVFAYGIRDMVTMKLLESMMYSTRQNSGQEKLNQLARMELQGSIAGGLGFMKKVEKMEDEVNVEISALDSTCMPCDKPTGLRRSSFGLSR